MEKLNERTVRRTEGSFFWRCVWTVSPGHTVSGADHWGCYSPLVGEHIHVWLEASMRSDKLFDPTARRMK